MRERVKQFLDSVRPAIQGDGGDVELIDVNAQGVVQLRLHGACIDCPSAPQTLRLGIERNLRQRVPEVSEVICLS
ncbi:MAG: NifU family protein [Phycisphaerae bacterium]